MEILQTNYSMLTLIQGVAGVVGVVSIGLGLYFNWKHEKAVIRPIIFGLLIPAICLGLGVWSHYHYPDVTEQNIRGLEKYYGVQFMRDQWLPGEFDGVDDNLVIAAVLNESLDLVVCSFRVNDETATVFAVCDGERRIEWQD